MFMCAIHSFYPDYCLFGFVYSGLQNPEYAKITRNGYLTFLEIAVSRDFCVFWVLEAAIGKFKETLVGIKVVYGSYKHFKRVRYEKWSYYVYSVAVKPFQTATFLEIAVSRDFCVFWILEAEANSKRSQSG